MIKFNEQRRTAVFYTCGVCNLNCRYCTIDKNPVLKDIDNELEESFKGDYYFNRVKAYFPRRDQLQRIETWGGEPFLRMDRIYPLLHQLINYYPYFEEMSSSTNFSYDSWINQFMGLMEQFGKYPYRHFRFFLQLSVDGPPYLNDTNRGIGVTERCIKNFDKLIEKIVNGELPQNVHVSMGLKGTWDIDCFHKLNNKEKLIEFFQFYEDNYMDKVISLNHPQMDMGICVPNTAVPAPTTQADGKIFAELVQKCREIEQENQSEHYFKYYNKITPFNSQDSYDNFNSYCNTCASCGSGQSLIGFLPHDRISACHEGFTLLAEQYKEFAAKRSDKDLTVNLNKFFDLHATPMCLTDDEYVKHERKMEYINFTSSVQVASAVTNIIALAMSGIIDQKYINETQALYAAKYILQHTSYCIKGNYAINGTFCNEPFDLYVLLLNGALDYLKEGGSCNGNCSCIR